MNNEPLICHFGIIKNPLLNQCLACWLLLNVLTCFNTAGGLGPMFWIEIFGSLGDPLASSIWHLGDPEGEKKEVSRSRFGEIVGSSRNHPKSVGLHQQSLISHFGIIKEPQTYNTIPYY